MLLKEFYDDYYPNNGFLFTRKTVRGLVFNEQGQIGLMHIKAEDAFGKRDHYETPGGGIERHEKRDDAIVRELEEELGYLCGIDSYLGMVINRCNTVGAITAHHFYVCHLEEKTSANWTDEEKFWFRGVVWKTPLEWIEVLSQPVEAINRLVHERDLFMIKMYVSQQEMLQD